MVRRLDDGNALLAGAGAALILDGCDNFATRLAVNRAAVAGRIPLLSAAGSARSRGRSRFMKGAPTAPAMPASSATTPRAKASIAPRRG